MQTTTMNKSVEHWQVECLHDEMNGRLSHNRFTDWEIKFITSLLGLFYNDPEYILTSKQKEYLQSIWDKP